MHVNGSVCLPLPALYTLCMEVLTIKIIAELHSMHLDN